MNLLTYPNISQSTLTISINAVSQYDVQFVIFLKLKNTNIKDSPLISFSLTMSTIIFPLTFSPLRYVAVGRSNSMRKVLNDSIAHSRQNYFYYV